MHRIAGHTHEEKFLRGPRIWKLPLENQKLKIPFSPHLLASLLVGAWDSYMMVLPDCLGNRNLRFPVFSHLFFQSSFLVGAWDSYIMHG